MNTMTIDELIAALQQARERFGNLPVITEGCDCDGMARGVEYASYGAEKCVIIARDRQEESDDS